MNSLSSVAVNSPSLHLIAHSIRPIRALAATLARIAILTAVCVFSIACGTRNQASQVHINGLNGMVHGGQQPISGGLIQLYAVGSASDGSAATPLISATVTTSDGTGNAADSNANAGNAFNTLPDGAFTITGDYTCPTPTSEVYLTATGGNPGLSLGSNNPNIALMAALGPCGQLSATTYISINEITTVGSIAPLSSFMSSFSAIGSGAGDATELTNAFAEVNEYVSIAAGTAPGPNLPAGYTAPTTNLQTLADIIATCINSAGGTAGDSSACGMLFTDATPPSNGIAPTDNVAATMNILNNPTNNVSQIFSLLGTNGPFQPTLTTAPANWTLPITASTATQLAFQSQPANTTAGAAIPSITVAIEDSLGNVLTSATNPVTIAIGANPASGTLTGTTTVSAIDGIATFSNLSINTAATGYTLAASSTSLTGTTSNSFNITAGAATKLAFTQQPTSTTAGQTITPSVLVSVEDAYSNIVTTSSASITIGIGTNPNSGTLSGTTTQTASAGTATFNNLSINNLGTGYTLRATSSSFTATSNSFNINGGSIGVNPVTVGNNLITQLSLSLPANAPATEQMTLTSADPTHFLLSTSATATGAASVQVTLSQNSSSIPTVYLQGQNFTGTTAITGNITASASGFTNGSGTMTLFPSGFVFYAAGTVNTTTFSTPTTVTTTAIVGLNPGSLTLAFENQPLGPQAGSVGPLTVTSSNTAVGTISGTGPTFNDTTGYFQSSGYTFQPATAGSSTVTLTEPAGYYISTSSSYTNTFTVNVTAPAISVASFTVANYCISSISVSVPSAPSTAWVLTLTSSDPTHFLLSTNPNAVGTGTLNINMAANSTSIPTIYVEGQNFSGTTAINANLTGTATGYTSGTGTLTLFPSGLGFYTGSFSTTTFSSQTGLTIGLNGLNPGSLTAAFQAVVGPQAPGGGLSATVTSGTTTVGTINGNPATWNINSGTYNSSNLFFVPAGQAGTSTLTINQPTGFVASTSSNWPSSITATVNAPSISVNSALVANNSIINVGVSVPSAPSTPWTLNISTTDPTHFLLSTSSSAVGTATLAINMAANSTSIPTVYIEGQNFSGNAAINATFTATATGFTSGSNTVTVEPSGFGWYSGSFSTTTFSSATGLTIGFLGLDPTTLAPNLGANIGPQAGTTQVTVTSGTTAVGTISGSPATWYVGGGTYQSGNLYFQPAGTAGTSTLTLTEPSGYTVPQGGANWHTSITATVNAPTINVNDQTVANNAVTGLSVSVPSAPSTPWTLTLTSGDPTHFLLTNNPTAIGSATLTINMPANSTGIPAIYIEGQNYTGSTAITASITATATGFTSGSATLTLDPSGFAFYTSSFNTTTTSSPTGLTVSFLGLTPGTLVPNAQPSMGPQALNPQVVVTSATPAVGTIVGSPATYTVDGSAYQAGTLTFNPAGQTGTSVLTVTQPTGFTAPNASNWPTSITANVPQ